MSHTNELWGGYVIDYEHPSLEVVTLELIVQHLSHINRFNGAMGQYSVAEHCVKAARMAHDAMEHPKYVLAVLLHDGHETYVGDISTPLKKYLGEAFLAEWRILTNRLDALICTKFDIPTTAMHDGTVGHYDRMMLAVEAFHGLTSKGESEHWHDLPAVSAGALDRYRPDFWDPETSQREFIRTFFNFHSDRHAPGW